jgi:hypothetical protein
MVLPGLRRSYCYLHSHVTESGYGAVPRPRQEHGSALVLSAPSCSEQLAAVHLLGVNDLQGRYRLLVQVFRLWQVMKAELRTLTEGEHPPDLPSGQTAYNPAESARLMIKVAALVVARRSSGSGAPDRSPLGDITRGGLT